MKKIQLINPMTAYKYNEHRQLIDKINEIIIAINKLLVNKDKENGE